MIKKILFPFFVFLVSCTSQNPQVKAVKSKAPSRHKSDVSSASTGPWIVKSYPTANTDQEGRKYVMLETDGRFSTPTVPDGYLNAVVIVDKVNAGILLHQSRKTSPAQKFTGSVHIKMKNPEGNELEITSSRGWNKSGGIMIERNNNDYSQFRIFMLQSNGIINVEIRDEASSTYQFDINAAGFGDAFGRI